MGNTFKVGGCFVTGKRNLLHSWESLALAFLTMYFSFFFFFFFFDKINLKSEIKLVLIISDVIVIFVKANGTISHFASQIHLLYYEI